MSIQFARRFLLSALAVAGFACASTHAAAINLVTDGGFEIPINPGNPFGPLLQDFPGGSSLGAWNVVGSDVLLIDTNYSEPSNGVSQFNAEEGTKSVDLTGAGNTGPTNGVTQNIATTIGQEYSISFYVGSASGFFPFYALPATDNVDIGLGVIPSTNTGMTAGVINWQQFSYDFVATGATTTVTFTNGTVPPTAEAGLDNVSVTAVPIPSSAIGGMVLFGLLGITQFRRWSARAI